MQSPLIKPTPLSSALRRLSKALFLIPLLVVVTGCSSVPTSLLSPDSLYPDSITSCAPEPEVPARPAPNVARPESVKATYLNGVRWAGADCRDTVAATAQRKIDYKKQYDAATAPAWKKLFKFGKKE
ncbi:Rz-like spanin [Caulobacter phage CcrColossus]|uniref:Putative outer membrane spanin component n=1 Tax=Caulobacter phage CcrColossus TaxID=1211640 RepID=K4K675_9CAUD|nr:Rz-like spanin [Caulobacter phage CcrColossus]AFU88007.1 putative outer membrane spanin component [Caulobacter phage CcrColossus]